MLYGLAITTVSPIRKIYLCCFQCSYTITRRFALLNNQDVLLPAKKIPTFMLSETLLFNIL